MGHVGGAGLAATSANAQMLAPYQIGGPRYSAVSDFDGPMRRCRRKLPAPRYGPMLLPAPEVYTVVRENGFSPLGIPRQRGFFYTISVINRDGDDGQLVIDARNGRIVRFVPAYRMGGNINRDLNTTYGLAEPLPPIEPGQGRAAAPGADPAAGEPHALGAAAPRDAAACRRAEAAGGDRAAPAQQSAAIQPRSPEAAAAGVNRGGCRRRGEAVGAGDPADAGDAEGAGPGVSVRGARQKDAPVCPGRFRLSNRLAKSGPCFRRLSRPRRRPPAEPLHRK